MAVAATKGAPTTRTAGVGSERALGVLEATRQAGGGATPPLRISRPAARDAPSLATGV